MKKIFSLFAALTLCAGLWAIDEDADAPENFSAEVVGTSYGSVTIKAYAEDDSGEIIYTVKESSAVIATANGISGVEKTFTVTGLESGTDYSLLVLAADPTGNETEGLSLRATTLATPEAPEAPIYADQDVISIFSDSYSAATSFNVGSWGQSTVSEEVGLADNTKAYFLSNADYLGWELATTIDVTNMKYVRFDVYPLDGAGTAIEFTPNWGGEKLLKQEGLVAGAWNTVTFSIEDFSGIVKDNINQLIWSNMPTEMFITNVLFYTDGADPAPVVGDKFVDETSGLKFEVTAVGEANTVMVIADNYTGTTYTIPATVKYNDVDFAVTEIGIEAFYTCSALESITLPESVTTIGEYAFYGCLSLETIDLSNITTLGAAALASCIALRFVTIPTGMTEIETATFNFCTALTSITIPANITKIGAGAFAVCSALSIVTFEGDACQNSIGNGAFDGVGATTPATLVLPDNWTGSTPVDSETKWYGGYFNYEAPSALPQTRAAVKATKVMTNGQVIFRAENKNYSVLGQEVR